MWTKILLLAYLCCYVKSIDTDPFDPTKFEVIYKNLPEENELEVGEKLIFKCEVSHEYEWCGFFHENCIIKPNETNCTYENIGRGRANVIEDPDKKFCQLTLANLSKNDDGNWTCKFKREHSIDNSDIANDSILIHIKYNLTSIISPITTTKTTDKATTTNEAITFEENRTSIVDENYNYSTVAIIIENSTSSTTITTSNELIPYKDKATNVSSYDEPDEGSGSNCNEDTNDNGICENKKQDEGSGDSCDDEDSEGCVNKEMIRSTTTFSSTTTISSTSTIATSTSTTTTTKATTTTKTTTTTTNTHLTTTATQIITPSTAITKTTPIRTTSSFTSPTPTNSILPDNTQFSKIHKKVQKIILKSLFTKNLQNSTI